VLGGHYGPSNLISGWRKGAAVAWTMLGGDDAPGHSRDGVDAALRLLQLESFKLPKYMTRDLTQDIAEIGAEINDDVTRALLRLKQRGIERYDQLVEAFQSEHRGGQYIDGQLLNCRAHIDVANPLADQRMFEIASALPMRMKVHNSINRRMLLKHAPDLARYPMAATLVRAAAPIWMQEASRAMRKLSEHSAWRLHFVTGGRTPTPHFSWVNFEFLRNGTALRAILDDLASDIWDRVELGKMITLVTAGDRRRPMHPVYDQFMKIYNVDLMLRRRD
jgi:hypothetical protein